MAIYEDLSNILFIPVSEMPNGIKNLGDSITIGFPSDQYQHYREIQEANYTDTTRTAVGTFTVVEPKNIISTTPGSVVGYMGFADVIKAPNFPGITYMISRTRPKPVGYPGFSMSGFSRQEIIDQYTP